MPMFNTATLLAAAREAAEWAAPSHAAFADELVRELAAEAAAGPPSPVEGEGLLVALDGRVESYDPYSL